MRFFYITTKSNEGGLHEIHDRECKLLPPLEKREYIGLFKQSKEALKKAIHAHPNAYLCVDCCKNSLYGKAAQQAGLKK
jgi:hypothetical protein